MHYPPGNNNDNGRYRGQKTEITQFCKARYTIQREDRRDSKDSFKTEIVVKDFAKW